MQKMQRSKYARRKERVPREDEEVYEADSGGGGWQERTRVEVVKSICFRAKAQLKPFT